MIAVVALKEQTLVLHDVDGVVRSSSVSSGLTSNPTPIGIFSVLEKRKEHWSNIYDAEMPFMQRLTWSGIALHEGRVTGRPASHGCVRLPPAVAEDLFAVSRVGMRVVISYSKTEPLDISHPVLFTPRRTGFGAGLVNVTATAGGEASPSPDTSAKAPMLVGPSSMAPAALVDARKEANSRARSSAKLDEDLKKRHGALLAEMSRLSKARDTVARTLATATRRETLERTALDTGTAQTRERSERALAAATIARVTAEGALREADVALTTKREANAAILEEIAGAEADAKWTWEVYRRTMRAGEPVSVLVSAKSGMLSVRQAFDPIFEVPVAIADRGGATLGTHLFTWMHAIDDGRHEMPGRWVVVTLPHAPSNGLGSPAANSSTAADESARAALDRIVMPSEIRARIEAVMVPGSSLIVTDHAASSETGKGTDFIIETNQPQPEGAIVRDVRRTERPLAVGPYRPMPRPFVSRKPSDFDPRKIFASDR